MQASSAEPETTNDVARNRPSVSIGRIMAFIVGICLWLLAMFGVLKLAEADLGMPHLVCGAWGCGPRTEALMACHGFWLLLLTPPAAVAAMRSTTATVHLVASTATAVGVTGVVVILGQQAFTALTQTQAGEPSYFWQRCLFELATLIELPLVQLILIGTLGFAFVGWRNRRFRAAQRVIAD